MAHASLASHYRPQTFAQVTGQEMVTTVLSRAAAEGKVAPAYLLSGTRGVGKTTIARIFAKALNCVNAPTSEPCNVCDQCQKITQGNHVDVTEIDGASNNSVDDARALREHIGYAAMEGRYKVFIIDEAHMLSKAAFNALLKTLEEPPARVVFIFATTEVHKFPITIVSRCQHFIYKRVSEEQLITHLSRVLEQENVEFEPSAVRIIARRAAGSVRDGMSLLGQSLALGEKNLSLDTTRKVLGLAGQEFFQALITSVAKSDCKSIVKFSTNISEQGLDIGFFLRELTSLWRTLFLLREAGKEIVPSLALSDDDARLWLEIAPQFSATHLHAAWHMTLDSQRKIIHSPEPAAALELLLLNLALMPRLLPIAKANDASINCNNTSDNQTAEKKTAEFDTRPNLNTEFENIEQENIEYLEPLDDVEPLKLNHMVDNGTQTTNIEHIKKTEETTQNTTLATTQLSWEMFCSFINEQAKIAGKEIIPSHILSQAKGEFSTQKLEINVSTNFAYEKLENLRQNLEDLCVKYSNSNLELVIIKPELSFKPEPELIKEFAAREDMQDCLEILDASIIRVRPMDK